MVIMSTFGCSQCQPIGPVSLRSCVCSKGLTAMNVWSWLPCILGHLVQCFCGRFARSASPLQLYLFVQHHAFTSRCSPPGAQLALSCIQCPLPMVFPSLSSHLYRCPLLFLTVMPLIDCLHHPASMVLPPSFSNAFPTPKITFRVVAGAKAILSGVAD